MINRPDPRGSYQSARILAALARPMTIPQLAPVLHLSEDGVRRYIKRLSASKQIRVCGWHQTVTGRVAPIYGLGGEPDAVYGEALADRREACILALLSDGPRTAQQLADMMERCATHVCNMLVSLRASKAVHVHSYIEPEARGSFRPVYALGAKRDAPMVKRPTRERYQLRLEQNRSYRRRDSILRQATARPQGIFAALGL